MKCPECGASDQYKCKESRPYGEFRYRRYLCLHCGKPFTTYELTIGDLGEIGKQLDEKRRAIIAEKMKALRNAAKSRV